MFRFVSALMSSVVIAYLASLAAPARAPEQVMTSLQMLPDAAPLYSGYWLDDAESDEPLWCDEDDDPRCAPAAPPAAQLTWAPMPTSCGQTRIERQPFVEPRAHSFTPCDGLAAASGEHVRLDRPPQA